MTKRIQSVKNAFAGNYRVVTTRSGGIVPTEFDVAHTPAYTKKAFETGMQRSAEAAAKRAAEAT
jgi:hypothetical protein